MTVTSSNLNQFSKFFHLWKDKEIYSETTYYFPPHLKYVTILPLGIIYKFKFVIKLPNEIKTRIIFVKNEFHSHGCYRYYHNGCSNCPTFAHTHDVKTSAPLVNCIANDALVHSMPNVKQMLLLSFMIFNFLNSYH